MSKKEQRGRKIVKNSENRILIAFLLNLIFTFVELWGSMLTGSITILSDAIHDFGDCFALGMAWRLEKVSKRPPNDVYHFGYRRFSVVAGLVNNFILLMGGVVLIVTSLQRFFNPRSIDGKGMLLFAVVGIIMNGAAMLLTSKGKNVNEKAISMHMLEDVLTWVAVLMVGIILCFYPLPVLDSLLSIGMTMVIFIGVAKNLKRIVDIITVRSPFEENEYHVIRNRMDGLNRFGKVETLRFYSMDGEDRWGEVGLVLYEEIPAEDVMVLFSEVRMCCESFGVTQVLIQFRYEVESFTESCD
ncbi:MAG: cation transporter [Lachnospiraceae bacterium]|nr:cation transporter [Lachnospiraceae bacterium]